MFFFYFVKASSVGRLKFTFFRMSIKLQVRRVPWKSRKNDSGDRRRLAHCAKQPSFQHWSSVRYDLLISASKVSTKKTISINHPVMNTRAGIGRFCDSNHAFVSVMTLLHWWKLKLVQGGSSDVVQLVRMWTCFCFPSRVFSSFVFFFFACGWKIACLLLLS